MNRQPDSGRSGWDYAEAPSAIPGSPWDRIEVWGTPAGTDGPHVVVTAAEELNPNGPREFVVGAYASWEEGAVLMRVTGLASLRATVLEVGAVL